MGGGGGETLKRRGHQEQAQLLTAKWWKSIGHSICIGQLRNYYYYYIQTRLLIVSALSFPMTTPSADTRR